jgi:uncharacterized protein (TIGR03000 family)
MAPAGGQAAPTGAQPETLKEGEKKPAEGEKKPMGMSNAPATILVSLPAEAQLTVDDHVTTSTSATRRFVSPALPRGQEFHYTLTAKITRDGKPVTTSKQVSVRAGEESRVTFEFPTATVAAK